MREILAVLIGFSLIPILTKKKVQTFISIMAAALVMGLLAGLSIDSWISVLKSTLLDFKKIQQYLTVVEIGALGVVLKKYNFIDKIIHALNKVVSNKKISIMLIPALIGLLAVPGGAIMSAPFVDKLGEEIGIDKSKRAVINLIFRHISMQIMPYSNGLLMMALLLPQVNVYTVIAFNLIFVVIYCVIGYFMYINNIPTALEENVVENRGSGNFTADLIELLKYTSPIYFAVLLNIIFKVPFYIGVLFNFLLVYLMNPTKTFISDVISGVNFRVFLTMVGVYLIQGTIGQLSDFNNMLVSLLQNQSTLIISIIGIAAIFGLSTGYQPTSLGVILPVLATLPLSVTRMAALGHIVYVWSFVGYFFSPLHLCQLFTIEYMCIDNGVVYKRYKKFIIALVVAVLIENIILLSIVK